jgi:hypothetical protein
MQNKGAHLGRLDPALRETHDDLVSWAEWIERYSELKRIPVSQLAGGGLLAGKRTDWFKMPFRIQLIDLAVCAVARSQPKLKETLYQAYLGTEKWPARAAALGMTEHNFMWRLRIVRSSVAVCVKMMRSGDLLVRVRAVRNRERLS